MALQGGIMRTSTITIGRNVGNTPMNETMWSDFQRDIAALFSELYVSADFLGVWNDIPETSHLFIGELHLENVETQLSLIALKYDQDAIGFILNSRPTSLVEKYKAA